MLPQTNSDAELRCVVDVATVCQRWIEGLELHVVVNLFPGKQKNLRFPMAYIQN